MLKKILIIYFLLVATSAFADEAEDKAEFNRLYAEFNDLYANSQELDPIILVAEKVYEIAPKAYGENHINTAVVTYNLASLYLEKAQSIRDRNLFEKTSKLFDNYFNILGDNKVPQDRNYVFQYLQYISAMSSLGRARSLKFHTSKVRGIVNSLDYNMEEKAEIEFALGIYLFNDNEALLSLDYFEKANELYNDVYGPNHFKTGESAFWIAKIEMARQKRQTAETYFLNALDAFENTGQEGVSLKQNTHAFLVALYEDMGNSDKATLHCRAVAEERPKDFDRHITPLYRKNPEFPKLSSSDWSQLKKDSVEVLLEFDVDENGFTRNVKILESENEKFNKNSLEAAEGYRYAPKVENGEIVETEGARVMIRYQVSR